MLRSEHSGDTLDELDRTPTRLSTDPTHNHSSLRLAYTQPGTGSNGVGASRVHAAGVREARKVSSNKKRKRDLQDTIEDDLVDELDLEEQSFPALEATVNNRSQKRLCIAAVKVPGLVYPKSLYHNWDRPSEVSEESKVLREFLDEQFQQEQLNQQLHSTSQNEPDDDEYISFQLTDFTIYIKPDRLEHEICLGHKQRFDYELVPLHALKCRAQVEGRSFLFDGILTNGRLKRYVERVPFELLSLGNYEQIALHSVDDQLMIASKKSIKQNVWYQLGKPSSEYERYHTPFLWLADLAKHFIDYLSVHERVVLNDFREKFYHWLDDQHGWDITFREWLEQFGHSDFRTAIAANTEFLWKEAADSALAYHERNQKQPIWSEVDTKHLTMLKEETSREKKTVVTPFVFNVFRNMKWAHYMDSRTCCPSLGRTSRYRHTKSELDLSRGTSVHAASEDELGLDQQGDFTNGLPQPSFPPLSTEKVESAKPKHFSVGDVIALPPDATTKWKSQDDLWFAYVQSVKRTSSGSQLLGLLWLYRKSDTTCDNGRYPYSNELFFSDNCSCEEKATYSSDAVAKVPVSFFGSPSHSTAGYFVRQKYRTVPGQEAFVTLRQSDFKCWHQSPETNKSDLQLFMKRYAVGDTILVPEEVAGTTILEPVEIVSFEQRNSREAVQMRRLLRRRRDYQDEEAKPNELVYSDDVYEIPVERLVDEDQCRRCHIRFYALTDLQECKIPAPYSRDGTADAYYIIYRQVGSGTMRRLEPIAESSMISLKQGFDPLSAPSRPPLRGMDLYCGGGNFGRGLEEGGAVQNRWAVDWAKSALHTYRANLEDPDATELYYGSVNDYLAKAMQGSTAKNIAKRGEVEFIAAGSPCQGFSNANQNKKSPMSLQNSSMVSSVAAFIDFYRPKYALLENVTAMASRGRKSKEVTVFSQLVCCLVAMGYQVQQFNIDAWSFGSPQSRRRLFISIAAPGLELPPYPALSHSHPVSTRNAKIGVAANGLSFGERRNVATPFKFVTAAEATKDMPLIGDAKVQTYIPYPDHRTSRVESTLTRVQISLIPRNPRLQTFLTTRTLGRMGEPQKEKYTQAKHRNKLGARSWGRIDPGALLPTITTSITPACGFQGRWLHWEEHRLLTVMEARRAQGFPDHEVLIGGPAKQWKIIGNSVARTVALALGMSMRSAWLANPPNVTDEEYLSLNVEVDRNHAVDLTREKPLVQISSRRTRTSVIGRLDEQAILSVSKERVTTQPNVSAALEGPRNTTDQENIARKSRTYRLLTAAAVEVQNNHSNPGPLTPKPKRDKEVPRGSMAKPASSPIIVISDDEEEVVYLGTSTPSSRVISSAQETPQNSDSSRTSVSVDELDILQSGTHGLLRQKPSTRRTSNMRY